MQKIVYTITDALGIHARPAGLIAKLAKSFQSKIMIGRSEKMVDASQIIGVMSLAMKQGENLVVTIEGEDETAAASAIEALLKENL